MLNLISAPPYGNHQKQDQKHHCMTANHLKVFCDHHCTLVHPCKTEHLQNFACFPFHASWMNVKICVQLEEVEICCWTSHLSAWLARKATMGGQLPSSDDPSSSTRKTFEVILWLKCLQASQETMITLKKSFFMNDLLHRNVPCYVELLEHHRPEPLKKLVTGSTWLTIAKTVIMLHVMSLMIVRTLITITMIFVNDGGCLTVTITMIFDEDDGYLDPEYHWQ